MAVQLCNPKKIHTTAGAGFQSIATRGGGEVECRRGSLAYLEFKLSRAQAHIEYLKDTPMTPRELGVITTQKDTTTKKKRII